MKENLSNVVKEYIDNKPVKGWPQSNLSGMEISGMKEIKPIIKDKGIVVSKSDKCGKMTIDSF